MKRYFVDLWESVSTVLIGMGVTFRHLFTRSVTQQYTADELPEERWRSPLDIPKDALQERSRMRLHVKIEDCIGCKQCERACPVDCIHIENEKRARDAPAIFAADGTAIKQTVVQFDIDMSLCCYCQLCVFPCPTDCILMTPNYEFGGQTKGDLLYRFAKEPRTVDPAAAPPGPPARPAAAPRAANA